MALVMRKFEQNLLSVKPWIPSLQLLQALLASKYRVFLRPTIEQHYYLPLYQRLKQNQIFKTVGILTKSDIPDLVITGDHSYLKEAVETDVRLVRPRKIKAFEELSDISQLAFRAVDEPEPDSLKKFIPISS